MRKKNLSKWNVALILMLVMTSIETLFAIPILGGLLIVALLWIPLAIALVGHIVTLVFANRHSESLTPSILGIIASVLGFIPIVGFGLHLAAAITGFVKVFSNGV